MLPFQNCSEFNSANYQSSEPILGEEEIANNDLVPVFMALGHMSTTMYTCDGGLSWKGYKTASTNLRCSQESLDNIDCDHATTSGVDMTYSPAGFMITFGWGRPGSVQLTADGKNFETLDEGRAWSGIAYGNGVHILNDRKPAVTHDNGLSWHRRGSADFIPPNSRRIEFVDQGGGFFISMAATGAVLDMLISRDRGETWLRPNTLPPVCSNGLIAYNNNIILLKERDNLCISTDQGKNWEVVPGLPVERTGDLIYGGGEFKLYARNGLVYVSTNGLNWTAKTLKLSGVENSNLNVNMISYHSALNRYVSITQNWQGWYESTKYYYSNDGVNWEPINKEMGAAPVAPHPIRTIVPGYIKSCD